MAVAPCVKWCEVSWEVICSKNTCFCFCCKPAIATIALHHLSKRKKVICPKNTQLPPLTELPQSCITSGYKVSALERANNLSVQVHYYTSTLLEDANLGLLVCISRYCVSLKNSTGTRKFGPPKLNILSLQFIVYCCWAFSLNLVNFLAMLIQAMINTPLQCTQPVNHRPQLIIRNVADS